MGFAFHALFEGVVVGGATDVLAVWASALAIAAHKWTETLATVRALKSSGAVRLMLVAGLCLASPMGALLGLFIATQGSTMLALVNAFSAGFVIFMAGEVLGCTFSDVETVLQLAMGAACTVAGLLGMAALMILHLAHHQH